LPRSQEIRKATTAATRNEVEQLADAGARNPCQTPANPLPAQGVEFDDDTKPQQATPKANTRVLPVHIEKIEIK